MLCVAGHAGPREFAIGLIYVLCTRIKRVAYFAWLKVPSYWRLVSFGDSELIEQRLWEENRIENLFYLTIKDQFAADLQAFQANLGLADADTKFAVLCEYLQHSFVPWGFERVVAKVTIEAEVQFKKAEPNKRKGRQPKHEEKRIHRGGSAVSLSVAFQAICRRVVAVARVQKLREERSSQNHAEFRSFASRFRKEQMENFEKARRKQEEAVQSMLQRDKKESREQAKREKQQKETRKREKTTYSKKRAGVQDIGAALARDSTAVKSDAQAPATKK